MRQSLRPRPRDGFVLPVALMAMIVIGAIVTGGFYVASQEHTVSVSTDQAARALAMAEYGLDEAMATMRGRDVVRYGVGTPVVFSPVQVMNGSSVQGEYRIGILPLVDETLYLIHSEGRAGGGSNAATRRVSSLMRLNSFKSDYTRAALVVYGEFTRSGNSTVNGADVCGVESGTPGVIAKDTSVVTEDGQKDKIMGDPPKEERPEMTADSLSQFGDLGLQDMIEMADIVYPNAVAPINMAPTSDSYGKCETSNPNNWGQPDKTATTHEDCKDYYPIIYSDGDLLLETGTGQGLLIVDGNLTIKGNLTFFGVVIVTGSLLMEGTGQGTGKISGTVIVQGEGMVDTNSETSGNAMIEYDSCNVRNAFMHAPRIRPLFARSWVSDAPPMLN
jgi:hypothetical protein